MVPDLIVLALDYYRAPLRYTRLRDPSAPLPESFDSLVSAVGATLSPRRLEAMAKDLGTSAAELDQAARFFLRQVLLAPGGSHYRALGVTPSADHESIRQHYQLLVRYFHPDRSQHEADRDAAYTARITQAYRVLKDPAYRKKYDRQLAEVRGRALKAATTKQSFEENATFLPTNPFAQWSAAEPGLNRRWMRPLMIGFAIALAAAAIALLFSARQPVLRVNPELADSSAARPSFLGKASGGRKDAAIDGRSEVPPEEIVARLVRYYEEGNLNALVGMFTENARVNEGSGTAFIRDEYAGFFAETAVRRLTVAGLDWRAADGGRLIGTGFFISSAQGNPGGRWRYQRGELRIDLVPSMGSFKISRMTHR